MVLVQRRNVYEHEEMAFIGLGHAAVNLQAYSLGARCQIRPDPLMAYTHSSPSKTLTKFILHYPE